MSNERIAKNVYIGMPVREFLRFADDRANLEAMTTYDTVYSLEVAGYVDDEYGVVGKKLFHFDSNGKLVRMESRDFREGHGRYRRPDDHRPGDRERRP